VRIRCSATVLKLSKSERIELQHQAEANEGRADSARHAKLILLLADGLSWTEIRTRLHCSDSYIARWSKRFSAERLAGLYSKHAGRERYKVTDRLESRVLARTTRHLPADGSGQWSSRKLAAELGGAISHTTVARIWAKHGVTPQRRESAEAQDQLPFDAKAADIIGLYLSPPQHAAIFSVDESVTDAASSEHNEQSPGAAHHGPSDHEGVHATPHEGVQALYAALKSHNADAADAAPASRQTSAEFAAFVASIAANQPTDKEIHVIADNLPAGKTRALTTLVADHPGVHLQFTATYDAWLDQVEKSLAEIESNLEVPGERQPMPDLKQKLMRHIRRWGRRPRPIKWNHLEASRARTGGKPQRNRHPPRR
jgi:transposase